MRPNGMIALAVGMLVLGGVSPASAQGDFRWNGRLATGQVIEVNGVNGDINATASSSGDVEVIATKSGRRSDPASVRIETVPSARGVTICAIYPAVPGKEPNRCVPGENRSNTRDNDVQVHFEVRIPYGVGFKGRTVNGEINAESLQGDVDLRTVNGSIRATTTGTAVASTVNGSLNLTMGRADWTDNASFKTVNGGITLNLPNAVDADVRAETLNGSITSDFPISVREASTRRLQGTIGNGGHELNLSTVNGSIKLRRAQ